MASSTPPSAMHYVSTVPIIDYRIEAVHGRDLIVWVRRKPGPAIVTIINFAAITLLVPALLLYFSLTSHPSYSRAGTLNGVPIGLIPIIVVVVGLALYRAVRGEFAQFEGIGGKERWLFAQGKINPPINAMGIQIPTLLPELNGMHICLNVTGGKWVIDFSSVGRNLYLGPFDSKALAIRCEADLKSLRPGWFAGSPGMAVISGVLGETRINGFSTPPEPITSVTPVLINDDGCLLELRRERGPRPGLAFLKFWLCFWFASEIVIGRVLLHDLTLVPDTGKKIDPSGELFMIVWFLMWSAFGVGAFGILTIGIRSKEIWKFTRDMITAGRSWHYFSKRQLTIDQSIQIRFGPFAGPPSVDFISEGLLLHLGPFATWELAGEAMGDLERQFPHWHWPSPKDR